MNKENILSNKIIVASIEVHKVLGPGLLESVYEEAMKVTSTERNIPFETQVKIPVFFKGGANYEAIDFLAS